MALFENVAVIGGGLGGCALALSLSQKQIPVQIFESRDDRADGIQSGIILTPNGLRVLDRLGVFERIRHRCYVSTYRIVKNRNDETTKKVPIENDKFGYSNHRVWRRILLDEMRQMLIERSVPVHYSSRFNGIVSEDADKGVTFRINDREEHASLLIGSDGVYSTVRKYLAPDVTPELTGMVGVLAHIKRSDVDWPYEGYESNATIQDNPGAIVWIAEDPEGEELMMAIQAQHPARTRDDLERLQTDKDQLLGFFTKRYDEWGPTARKIIDAVVKQKQSLYGWPFLQLPRMPYWYSETGRIILAGDSAHAVPPASGQGVNQALEDAYSLTFMLSSLNGREKLIETLAFWQQTRRAKIDMVLDWMNGSVNVERLGDEERKRLIAEGKIKQNQPSLADDMTWLFGVTTEDEFGPYIKKNLSA